MPYAAFLNALRAITRVIMMNNLHIKYMTAEHIDQIAILEKQCFSTPWSSESLRQELDVDNAVFLVALYDNNVVGYVGMHNNLGEGYITNVAVDEHYRRKSIGQHLISALFDYAADNNMQFISLEVRVSNNPAISLYEKLGFEKLGIRKRFYSHPTEDALIMTRYFK